MVLTSLGTNRGVGKGFRPPILRRIFFKIMLSGPLSPSHNRIYQILRKKHKKIFFVLHFSTCLIKLRTLCVFLLSKSQCSLPPDRYPIQQCHNSSIIFQYYLDFSLLLKYLKNYAVWSQTRVGTTQLDDRNLSYPTFIHILYILEKLWF